MTATGATPQEPSSASVDDENPWPGLASYQETDSRFFQGRERQIEALNELVHRERLTVLFGMAGLGKTSLLRAGLFPKLRERDELPVLVRLRFDPAAGTLRHQVFEAISRAAEEAGIEAPPCSESETLWEFFHRVETNFWSPRNRLTTPVLVVDQFEEIFTVGRHREGTEGFLEELSNLVEGRPSAALKAQLDAVPTEARRFDFGHHRYRVLLSLREDFLAELEGLRARMPSSAHNRMWLRPMDGEAALLVVDQTKGRLISTEIARAVVQVASESAASFLDGSASTSSTLRPTEIRCTVMPAPQTA